MDTLSKSFKQYNRKKPKRKKYALRYQKITKTMMKPKFKKKERNLI